MKLRWQKRWKEEENFKEEHDKDKALRKPERRWIFMIATLNSCGLLGIDGYQVTVEVDISRGIPAFDIVGLPDAAVKEARERVRAAIKNTALEFPSRRITVNLAPADVKKAGASYDLPIAVGILLASDQLRCGSLPDYAFAGELSLNGDLRPINGVLSIADCAKRHGKKYIVVPKANAFEAAVIEGITVLAPDNLAQLLLHLNGTQALPPIPGSSTEYFKNNRESLLDFADVKGQQTAKYALEIAAAGGHNCLMIGPPGSGKTMLAQRLPSILPDLTLEEALEVTKIHSVAGELPPNTPLLTTRPFRHPHHTSSAIRLVGGGTIPKPGEISLAHHGVLFLDEFPEFDQRAIEVMRQPLEDGTVTISRVNQSLTYPCNTMLIASMNPCKCGHYQDPRQECTCTPSQVKKYLSKISGPMLDRIDLHIRVASVQYDELRDGEQRESSEAIRRRVNAARERQLKRYQHDGIFSNSQLTAPMLERYCPLDDTAAGLLRQAFDRLGMSARGYSRILKVARTIADLQESDQITCDHLMQAISFRSFDRENH